MEQGPKTARQIVRGLEPTKVRLPELRRTLSRMVQEGEIVALRGRRFAACEQAGDVVGRLVRTRTGAGWVAADDPTRDDLFIPVEAQSGALHGDIVAARVVGRRRDGRPEGRIVRVIERKSEFVVGLFHRTGSGGGLVEPLDRGFGFDILVPKRAKDRLLAEARTGEIVTVRLDTPPLDGRPPRGRLVERLGAPDTPGIDVEILVRKYGLESEFPREVIREVEALPGEASAWPVDQREDFTSLEVVTIDGSDAKDYDDAIHVRRLEDGGFELQVFIADVDFFVARNSAIEREALRRGTSVYFPGRVIPMLPERLSNDLCSLLPGELRLTQGVSIIFDREGRRKSHHFHDGVIRSKARMTYEEVSEILDGNRQRAAGHGQARLAMLDAARDLTEVLVRAHRRRGGLDFDLPEPAILFDLEGATTDIVARPRLLAHRMIEGFMIAANEAVAAELSERNWPTIYRVHERPDPLLVARLAQVLEGMGCTLPEPYENLRPGDFAKVLTAVEGRPEEGFVSRQVLRSLALARYDTECLGHFGLALDFYGHFTSPIRRYPDLVMHRALRDLRRAERDATFASDPDEQARLPEVARETSRLERDAEAAERESLSWKRTAFMADRLGEEYLGEITDISTAGVAVSLAEPYVEGFIPITRLGTEYFRFVVRRRLLEGSRSGRVYKLGQRIKVRVDRVDLLRHQIDFCPVDEGPTGRRPARPPRRGRRKGRVTSAKHKAKPGVRRRR